MSQKKQYFRRPYRLVIIYYGIDNAERPHLCIALAAHRCFEVEEEEEDDEDGKRSSLVGMPMIHERRKAMLRCFLFYRVVFFCFDTNK